MNGEMNYLKDTDAEFLRLAKMFADLLQELTEAHKNNLPCEIMRRQLGEIFGKIEETERLRLGMSPEEYERWTHELKEAIKGEVWYTEDSPDARWSISRSYDEGDGLQDLLCIVDRETPSLFGIDPEEATRALAHDDWSVIPVSLTDADKNLLRGAMVRWLSDLQAESNTKKR